MSNQLAMNVPITKKFGSMVMQVCLLTVPYNYLLKYVAYSSFNCSSFFFRRSQTENLPYKFINQQSQKIITSRSDSYMTWINRVKVQESYRKKEKDWTNALHFFCFIIRSIQFSVSKWCAGPNIVFNTFMDIVFAEWLDDKEFCMFIISYEIWGVKMLDMKSRSRSNVFTAISRSFLWRNLACGLQSPRSSVPITRNTKCICRDIDSISIPFTSSTSVTCKSSPVGIRPKSALVRTTMGKMPSWGVYR